MPSENQILRFQSGSIAVNIDLSAFKKSQAFAVRKSNTEVPNRVLLQRELLGKQHLGKYKSKRRSYHIHKAAAKVWARGVPWVDALDMVQEAFDATTFEAENT